VRYCDGKVPGRPGPPPEGAQGFEAQLETDAAFDDARGLRGRVLDAYERLAFSEALGLVWSWVGQLNQRIVAVAPWEVAKDAGRRAELDAFLYRLLEGVRLVAVLAGPVMPRAASRILAMLGQSSSEPTPADLAWGGLVSGAPLGVVEPLFPRLEKEKTVPEPTTPSSPSAAAPAASPAAAGIDIADFARVDLRVARVLEAEKIAGSKKLVRLQVDLGDEKRQVVAGIAEAYAPEALVGRTVVLVANLKPAKLMGVESNGMVLAASVDGKAVLCGFDVDVAPGTKVK
jgi:methionyl-tRNA synthetase